MPAPAQATSSARATLLALLLVAAAALALRFGAAGPPPGDRFDPRPDSLEYVAGAQAIAQEGRYFLQLGPDRLPPRYAPGWPLLLAPALRAGVRPTSLWTLTATLDAALVVAFAALAAGLARRALAGAGSRVAALGPAAAALLAGLVLAGSSGRVRLARTVLSDPASLLAALCALALAAWGLEGGAGAGRRRAALAAAGAAGALAIALRPLDGAAAALAGLVLLLFAARRRGARAVAPDLAALVLGAVPVVALVGALLVRSDRSPWRWTAYTYWVPRYEELGRVLDPSFALGGSRAAGGRERDRPGLAVALEVLAGTGEGRRDRHAPGAAMAALALLGAVVAFGRREGATAVHPLALALAAWGALHTLAYAAYFYRLARFYSGPAALLVVAGAWGAAVAMARGRLPAKLAATVLAALALAVAAGDVATVLRAPARGARAEPLEARVAGQMESWGRRPPRLRARSRLPFDPLEAQALGLLRTRDAATFPWGELPATEHTRRLRGELAGEAGP